MKKSISICLILFVALSGCSLANIAEEEKSPINTLIVGPDRVTCTNPLRNNLCYQVKVKMEDAWQLYDGEIMGFQYVSGNIYELKVQQDTISVTSSGDPEVQWVMVQLVSSLPAPEVTTVPAELQETYGSWSNLEKPITFLLLWEILRRLFYFRKMGISPDHQDATGLMANMWLQGIISSLTRWPPRRKCAPRQMEC